MARFVGAAGHVKLVTVTVVVAIVVILTIRLR